MQGRSKPFKQASLLHQPLQACCNMACFLTATQVNCWVVHLCYGCLQCSLSRHSSKCLFALLARTK